ncbi:MAG: hypothetical protein ACR2PA_03085 [Hyphomicrobiaceae bacterium]
MLVDGVDALHSRATLAGATIVYDSQADDFEGRSFGCKDREGHMWMFSSVAPRHIQPRLTQRTASRVLAGMTLGSLAVAIGLSGWLYVGFDGADRRMAFPVESPSEALRARPSQEITARRQANQKASKLTQFHEEKREALEQKQSTIAQTETKLAVEEKKRQLAEQSVRKAMASLQSERARREAIAKLAQENAEIVAILKREFHEPSAQLASKPKRLQQHFPAKKVRPQQTISNAEQMILQERVASKAAELKANKSIQILEQKRQAHMASIKAVHHTQRRLAKERNKRMAAESSIKRQAAVSKRKKLLQYLSGKIDLEEIKN